MLLPNELLKREPSPTRSASGGSQTFVDSSSVVSAVTKLDSTIESLKAKNKTQAASLNACIAVIVVVLVLNLVFGVIVLIRFLNRKRLSQGLGELSGTRWAMFSIGPAAVGANPGSGQYLEKNVSKEVIHLGPPGLAYGATQGSGGYNNGFGSAPPTNGMGAAGAMGLGAAAGIAGAAAMDKLEDIPSSNGSSSTFINDHSNMGPYGTMKGLSTDSTLNMNRGTIDIEFDPHNQNPGAGNHSTSMSQEKVIHDYTSNDNGESGKDAGFGYNYNPGLGVSHSNDSFSPSSLDHAGDRDPYALATNTNVYSHHQSVSEVSALRPLGRKAPAVEDEEYDGFDMKPGHSFLTVSDSTRTAPNGAFQHGDDNRMSVVSSVYSSNVHGGGVY